MLPIVVYDESKTHLFGLFKISHLIEDRFPNEERPNKYKHLIQVRILWYTYNFVIRTQFEYLNEWNNLNK